MSGEPVILYDNILERSTTVLTASDTASGYDVANTKDRLLFTKWRSGPTATRWQITTGAHTGTFQAGETITGGTSGVAAVLVYRSSTSQFLIVSGWNEAAFTGGETLTGSVSGATTTYSSIGRISYFHADLGASTTDYGNAWAVSGHDLVAGFGSLSILYSTDNVNFTAQTTSWLWGSPAPYFDRTRLVYSTDSLSAKRYWLFLWGGTASNTINIGAFAWGKALVFPEYMALGFDPLNMSMKAKQGRSRDGSFLGQVVEHLSQRVELKFSDSGLIASSFFDATARPCWDDFLRTCWSHGKPFWFSPYGGNQDGGDMYCFPGTSEKHGSGWISGTQRNLKFGMDVLVEDYLT